jgi:hypothetical protein
MPNFIKIRQVGAELFDAGAPTDGHNGANSCFPHFFFFFCEGAYKYHCIAYYLSMNCASSEGILLECKYSTAGECSAAPLDCLNRGEKAPVCVEQKCHQSVSEYFGGKYLMFLPGEQP